MTKNYKDVQKEVFSEEFKNFCRKNISKDFGGLEIRRKIYILGIVLVYIVAISICVFGYNCLVDSGEEIDGRCFGTLIAGAMLVHEAILNRYKKRAKTVFLPKIISYIGNLKVVEETDPLRSELKNYVSKLELISRFNRFYCDDYFIGMYKDVEFSVSELNLNYVSCFGVSQSVEDIFQGLLISFKSFKEFSQNVLVKPDVKWYVYSRDKKPKYSRVNLEDPEFEKLFNVYCNDQIEARYLITPAFMNRMV